MKLLGAILLGTAVPSEARSSASPLLLTDYIRDGDLSGAKNASRIRGLNVGTTTREANLGYAGFVSVPSESAKRTNQIYTWLQPCSDCESGKDSTTPFIVWLQGGPGGPGTFGSFSEIGNYWVDGDLRLQERCFAWCASANCLFVDQPTMTGYSFQSALNGTIIHDPKEVEYTTTSPHAMEQVYQVIVQMFTIFPEFKEAPLYVTGESYGGLYTANLGWTIYNHNKALQGSEMENVEGVPTQMHINFVGLAVGDPIMHQAYQWNTYADTLYGMGVIMADEREVLRGIMRNGTEELRKWEAGEGDCWTAFQWWNSVWQDDVGGGLPGKFFEFTGSDMTENVLLGGQPAGFNHFSDYMDQSEVAEAMHATGGPTHSSAEGGDVYHTMVKSGDFCQNSTWIYASLFEEAGIDLMIYSSTSDPLLGPPTTEAGIHAILDYSTKHFGPHLESQYKSAKKAIWKVDQNDTNVAGYARCVQNSNKKRFCYTVVRNGGHETPAFQPRTSYDMFERFRQGRSFGSDGDSASVPTCAQCSGVPPFAGSALPECN